MFYTAELHIFYHFSLLHDFDENTSTISVALPPGTNFRDQIYRKIAANQRS
jgi:hypothetical protein